MGNAILELWLAKPSWYRSHYTVLSKYGNCMRLLKIKNKQKIVYFYDYSQLGFMLSHRSGKSNSRPSYSSGEFFAAYLCRNSWKGILLGKPFRQIRIPSSTPLHLSWCKTRLDSITPAFLCSLGTMQRTKWGQVLYRVSISRVSCSLMKIWTQLAYKSRTLISILKTPESAW